MSSHTYSSVHHSLSLWLGEGAKSKHYQFKNGVLTLNDEEDLLMQKFLSETAPSNRALIHKIDLERAKKVALEHAARMRDMGGVIQGTMSATAQAKRVEQVTNLIAAQELQSVGIDPQVAMQASISPIGEDDPAFVRAVTVAQFPLQSPFKALKIPGQPEPEKT